MSDLNRVTLIGRLTRDAELNITLFGKLGEAIAQYMTKGQQVAVDAHLQQDRWDDKETGKKRSAEHA